MTHILALSGAGLPICNMCRSLPSRVLPRRCSCTLSHSCRGTCEQDTIKQLSSRNQKPVLHSCMFLWLPDCCRHHDEDRWRHTAESRQDVQCRSARLGHHSPHNVCRKKAIASMRYFLLSYLRPHNKLCMSFKAVRCEVSITHTSMLRCMLDCQYPLVAVIAGIDSEPMLQVVACTSSVASPG